MKIASAYDGKRQQNLHDPVRLRLKDGSEGASYVVGTPQIYAYQWLRHNQKDFRLDVVMDPAVWDDRFRNAIYIGSVNEDGHEFESVDFPQALGNRDPCIYRVYFARELGFLPLKYFRHRLGSNELSTTMEINRYKVLNLETGKVVIPLALNYRETRADRVSKATAMNITVDEATLKVNASVDETLFTLNSAPGVDVYDVDLENALLGDLPSITDSYEPTDARSAFAAALLQAKTENKRVLVQETASNCPPCRQLTQLLEKQRKQWEQDYIWLKIDSRDFYAREVLANIRGENNGGIPWYAILDSDGVVLVNSEVDGENIGYPTTDGERRHFGQSSPQPLNVCQPPILRRFCLASVKSPEKMGQRITRQR